MSEKIRHGFLALFTVIMTLCFLSACGSPGEAPAVGTGSQQETAPAGTEASKPADKETESPEQNETETSEAQPEDVSGDTYVLSKDGLSRMFYVVDGSGKTVRAYDRDALKKGAEAAGQDLSRFHISTADESYERCVLKGADGRFAYFVETDGTTTYVYAVNADTFKVYGLTTLTEGSYVEAAECYRGNFCLLIQQDSGKPQEEYYYEYDEASDSFTEKTTGLDSLFRAASSKGYDLSTGMNDRQSCSRTLEESGCLLGQNDHDYAVITPDERIIPLKKKFDSYVYVLYYDDEYMFYSEYDEERGHDRFYRCDLYSGETDPLIPDAGDVTMLGFFDGDLYYYISEEKEYGKPVNSIYSCVPGTGSAKLLYSADSIPGVNISPGTEGFKVIGGDCYCLAFMDGDSLKWVRAKATGGKADYEDIGCPDSRLSAFEFGTVEGGSYEYDCPNCGTPLAKRYGERFILNGSLSDKAGLISEDLKKKQEDFLSPSKEDLEFQGDPADCEEHKANPERYCVTDDLRITAVAILNEKYLTVNVEGYWYGGGAHGYPNRNQYMYDLKTGKQVTIKDLYPAPEEVFKTLVAEQTVKNMQSYDPDQSPYFASDANELYQQAFDSASLETTYIEFGKDEAYIVYSPYDMGAYASGYIEVPVSYKDLLGRPSL